MESTESSIGFQQYWSILKRRWMPASAVFGSVFALTAVSLLLQKPAYEAEGQLLFKKASPTSSLTGVGKEIGQMDTMTENSTPVDTEAVVIRSAPIVRKTIARLNLEDESGAALKVHQLLKRLNVSNIRGTDVLQVTYRDTNPKKAATVVNTLMAVYLEQNLLANRAETVAARQFIEKQLPAAEATGRKAELALRNFKEKNNVVDLKAEANSAVQIVAGLQQQIASTQTQLADANAQSVMLKNQLKKNVQQAGTATAISQLPKVQEVLKQVQQAESQLAIDSARFRENHPTIASLKDKRADLERLLKQRVRQVVGGQKQESDDNLQISLFEQNLTENLVRSEARRLGLVSQLAALSQLQAAYKQRVHNLPSLEKQQRELEQQLQASQSTYTMLLQKLQEMRIAENQNIGNARVVASAVVPDDPVSDRKMLNIVTVVLVSSLFSLGAAMVLEATDKSIRTVEEAKKLFGFISLGLIPSFKKSEKITFGNGDSESSIPEVIVRDSPRSPFSAAYRMLPANLKFLSSDKEIKVIVVTSSVPNEGKSTVSANLAVAMAQLGRKVLLVDADMHRPVQHKVWDLPNQLGLSNILVGQAELRTVIKKVMVNLHVLNSGTIPPNPMALLDSQRMTSLMEIFSANYDFTIIDTSSLNVAADGLILGKMTDGVLLVVRPGVVNAASAAIAKEFLQQSGQKVLGQVINGVIPENEPHSYYHFSKAYYPEESAATAQSLPSSF